MLSALATLVDRAKKTAGTEHLHEELKFLKDIVIQHGFAQNDGCCIVHKICDKPVQEKEAEEIRDVAIIPFYGPVNSLITPILQQKKI